jgi:hypothetical protein
LKDGQTKNIMENKHISLLKIKLMNKRYKFYTNLYLFHNREDVIVENLLLNKNFN